MHRLFRGRPFWAGGGGGDVSPWRRGSYLLRSLSGFVPGSVSFLRDRVHSVPFFMPCMKNIPFVKLRRPLAACFSISGAGMLPHPRPPPHVDKKFT